MSLRKRIIFYNEETGETKKEYDVSLSEFAVNFKVGSNKNGKSSRFSKVFQMEDPNFDTPSYYKYYYKCLLNLEMITNRLVNFTYETCNNTPLTEEEMTSMFGCSHRTTLRFLEYCKDSNIMAKMDKNDELWGYVVNPIYALNGNKIYPMLYMLFSDNGEMDKHIPEYELKKLKQYIKCQSMTPVS
jgi:hypothetical protein